MKQSGYLRTLLGPDPGDDLTLRRAFMTRVVCLIIGILSGLLALLFVLAGFFGAIPKDSPLFSLLLCAASFTGLLLAAQGRQKAAPWIPVTALFLIAVFGNIVGGPGAPAMLIFALAVTLAGTLLGSPGLWTATAFSFIAMVAIFLLHTSGFLPPPRQSAQFVLNRLVIMLGTLAALAALLWFQMDQYTRVLNRVRETLSRLTRQMTENKKIQKEKEVLQARIFQSRKMETVGRMAGGVTHDFNNILTAILGHTDIGLAQSAQGLSATENLQAIRDAALRASTFTKNLLTFCKKDREERLPVDLRRTIMEMEGAIRDLLGISARFAFLVNGSPLPALMSPGQIERIILNLAVNAKEAMPQGGLFTITITPALIEPGQNLSRWFESTPGYYTLLSFSDTGTGMDEEILSRLFEPFYTTKPEGTGLGLATVYAIVKQNRGLIGVDSEPGRGTLFRVYLPEAGEKELPAVTNG